MNEIDPEGVVNAVEDAHGQGHIEGLTEGRTDGAAAVASAVLLVCSERSHPVNLGGFTDDRYVYVTDIRHAVRDALQAAKTAPQIGG